MNVAIMQPYFLPYIGYFQLIGAVDLFIVYDNIKYTKKGWINRNRMLQNGADVMFSLPLKSDSDYLDVRARELAGDFDGAKLLKQIENNYRKAPHFAATFALVERIVRHGERNLFGYLVNSLRETCAHLGLTTEIVVSSSLPADHALKGQERVIDLCRTVGATTYINPIGGTELYAQDAFGDIELRFLRARPFEYAQLQGAFVPWLSILDVMMFNSPERVRECIATGYDLIKNTEPAVHG